MGEKEMEGRRQSPAKGLFVTDLDGTLLNDARQISQADLSTLQSLQQSGYITAIATGRSYYSFTKLMGEYPFEGKHSFLPVNYVIFSTGSGIMQYPDCRILRSLTLTAKEAMEICSYLDLLAADYMVQRAHPHSGTFFYRQNSIQNEDFWRRIDLYGSLASPFAKLSANSYAEATEVLSIVPEDKGELVAERLRNQFPRLSVVRATSPLDHRSAWIEIFTDGVSKSKAVAWLCKRCGLSFSKVCAVGNDYNDVDLLELAAGSFITANAPKELRQRFSVVVANSQSPITAAASSWLNAPACKAGMAGEKITDLAAKR